MESEQEIATEHMIRNLTRSHKWVFEAVHLNRSYYQIVLDFWNKSLYCKVFDCISQNFLPSLKQPFIEIAEQ